MTTSLAQYLVDNGYCSLLVPGVKEPHAFLDPNAPALVARSRGWLLDASVVYIVKPEALRAIRDTVDDYRIIVCMRNQVERTVSAWAYYKSSIAHPNDSLDLVFGNHKTRARLANDAAAPAHLRRGPIGKYAYTAILTTLAGISEPAADGLIEKFARQSFAQRLLYESRFLKDRGTFTPLSILLHSYYAYFLRQLLDIIEPSRVMLVTPEAPRFASRLGPAMNAWLGTVAEQRAFPRTNQSRLPDADVVKAKAICADVMGAAFSEQTAQIASIPNRWPLFHADALFHAS